MSGAWILLDRLAGLLLELLQFVFGAVVVLAAVSFRIIARLLFWPAFVLMMLCQAATLLAAQLCGFLGGLTGRQRPPPRR